MKPFDIIKNNSILCKILLSDDIEEEIDIVGRNKIYNDNMYKYIVSVLTYINFKNYEIYKLEEVLERLKKLIILMENNFLSKNDADILKLHVNEIVPINMEKVIYSQIENRTFSFLNIYYQSKKAFHNYNYFKDIIKNDYNLILYFEERPCEININNIQSLIYFYNFINNFYIDYKIYVKTIELINSNIEILRESNCILSHNYNDNKRLLKEIGDKYGR